MSLQTITVEVPSHLFCEPGKSAIYGILNLVNGKIYIGSAVKLNIRWSSHRSKLTKNKHVNIYLQRAWNKYSELAFEFVILEYCNVSKLIEREQYWIELIKSNIDNFGYNIRKEARSNLGLKYPQEGIEKVRKANIGRVHSIEHRAKNSAANIGHGVSEETRLKIKLANSDLEKWPHGYKCNCRECLDKKNLERRLKRYNREGEFS